MGRPCENVSAERGADRIDADSGGRRKPAHCSPMGTDRAKVMIARLSWLPVVAVKKEFLAWVAGGLASLLVFLFLTFPFGTLQARVLAELIRATGWEIRATDWSPSLPLAVEWHELTWTKPGGASIPVQLMRLNVGV